MNPAKTQAKILSRGRMEIQMRAPMGGVAEEDEEVDDMVGGRAR